ncbi:hypothetical protein LR48_Vigan10g250100 [Vigna angularis]|uniref:Uncharacterized protein n=1 Tax=Phaseolus angularis TaxID=3914 RepID=A0A0L9VPE6_PHAAN|nr:hypothetical protein LR48_Vigan10g250100 [Vigna angularis]
MQSGCDGVSVKVHVWRGAFMGVQWLNGRNLPRGSRPGVRKRAPGRQFTETFAPGREIKRGAWAPLRRNRTLVQSEDARPALVQRSSRTFVQRAEDARSACRGRSSSAQKETLVQSEAARPGTLVQQGTLVKNGTLVQHGTLVQQRTLVQSSKTFANVHARPTRGRSSRKLDVRPARPTLIYCY